MNFYKNQPIPLLEAGPERELMVCFLERVKRMKGLTKALVQQAGVNAKWLKPDEPRNFPVKRFLRITLHTMYKLDRDEFKQRVDTMIDYTYDHILPTYANLVSPQVSKRKQRPPSIRRLYRRRYRRSKKIIFTHQINTLWNIQQPSVTFCMASATPAMLISPCFSGS